MRIQLYTINFAPELTGIAPYSTGLAQHLSTQHDVTVITGVPHYPDWRVPDEFRRWRREDRTGQLKIIRLRHFVPRSPSVLGRLTYELTWAARAATAGRHIPTDLVIAVVPALFAAPVARWLSRHHRVPYGIYVQDIMGSAAAQSGVRGGERVAGFIKSVERSALAAADAITTIHPKLATELAILAERRDRPSVIYNWTHLTSRPDPSVSLRHHLGWRDDEVVALHSGNMGAKQNLEVVVDAARLASRDGRRVRFVLAGGGSRRDSLKKYAGTCRQVDFIGGVPESEYMNLLAAADVLIVNERPGMREMSLPSKLTSYLVAGRPIVAATDPASSTAEFVEASGGGVVTPAGNPGLLLETVDKVAKDRLLAHRLVTDGQEFARLNLSQEGAMAAYDLWIEKLAASKNAGAT